MTLDTPAVYVAAPLAQTHRARHLARCLRTRGCRVVSRWHATVVHGAVDPTDEATRARLLLANVADLEAATVLLAVTDRGWPRATLVEIGWALGRELPIVWLAGAGANLFTAHPRVTVAATELEALGLVAGRRRSMPLTGGARW